MGHDRNETTDLLATSWEGWRVAVGGEQDEGEGRGGNIVRPFLIFQFICQTFLKRSFQEGGKGGERKVGRGIVV